jgi:hypothetical protein
MCRNVGHISGLLVAKLLAEALPQEKRTQFLRKGLQLRHSCFLLGPLWGHLAQHMVVF